MQARDPGKRCLVAVDGPRGPVLCPVTLPAEASIAAALAEARQWMAPGAPEAAGIDWDHAPVGIWGRRRERRDVPVDGDRIELYRPLAMDPRQRRRARARAATKG